MNPPGAALAARAAPAGALAALTILGWLFFPGHTFLHSDTQIYLPILDRLWDPSLYPKDPVALHPHVSYTVYDEAALALRWLTGLEFQHLLQAQQLMWRACGLLGVFLIARALRLSTFISLMVASLYGLGAIVNGPSVLILEYEPVPRGFAGPLLMLSIGLAAHYRWRMAGLAWALAFLYHPPTTYPVTILLFVLLLLPGNSRGTRRMLHMMAPMGAAVVLLLVLSRVQPGSREPQEFFGVISPEIEKLQRFRGAYNWVSQWGWQWIRQYIFLGIVCMAAWIRLRQVAEFPLRQFLMGLPMVGLLSIPVSYALLEGLKWILMPQFQPARAAMYVSTMALVGSGVAGVLASQAGRTVEGLAWFYIAFAIPAQAEVLTLLVPDLNASLAVRWLVVVALALAATLAARWEATRPRWCVAAGVVVMLAPFWAMPGPAEVRNYQNLDEPELHQLAEWARANTAKDALFLFPEFGRGLQPGFFRVYSKRSLWVDWKSGGQVNLLRQFALEWWDRWKQVDPNFEPRHAERYARQGVDYLVLKAGTHMDQEIPKYANTRYAVFSMHERVVK